MNIVKQTMPTFTEDDQKYKRVALKVSFSFLALNSNDTDTKFTLNSLI